MHIAITGGTGFIGHYMIRGLSTAGHTLRILTRPHRETHLPTNTPTPLEIHTGDLTSPATLTHFLADIDILIHLASAHDHFTESEMKAVNIQGTEALLSEAKSHAPLTFNSGS